MLDAGSSHTNLYVYEWPAEKENDTRVVQQVEVCKVEGKRKEGSSERGWIGKRMWPKGGGDEIWGTDQ